MIVESLDKNLKLKLQDFQASGNDFGSEGMQALGLVFERMKSLETVIIKNCINPFKKHSGLKFIIQGLI
jgi:hypothetical protein